MNLLKTFSGSSIEELQYKKAKWLRSLAPAVIFIVKEEYVPSSFFGNITLKVYFIQEISDENKIKIYQSRNYIYARIYQYQINETGNVSISEQKVCYIFHKILKELEGSDGNEQSGIKGFN